MLVLTKVRFSDILCSADKGKLREIVGRPECKPSLKEFFGIPQCDSICGAKLQAYVDHKKPGLQRSDDIKGQLGIVVDMVAGLPT